jgi:hypothetical protein
MLCVAEAIHKLICAGKSGKAFSTWSMQSHWRVSGELMHIIRAFSNTTASNATTGHSLILSNGQLKNFFPLRLFISNSFQNASLRQIVGQA